MAYALLCECVNCANDAQYIKKKDREWEEKGNKNVDRGL